MNDKHVPAKGTRARVKTQDRGGNIKPEGTTSRVKTSGRAIVEEHARAPQGNSQTIKPEATKARMTGDYQNAAVKTRMQAKEPKATRETPRPNLGNPFK